MKKKKVTGKQIMPIVFTAAVCACTVAGLNAASYLEGKPAKLVNDNGEAYVSFDNKADIVGNIYEQQGKLVILEIVPYENAGIMEMLTGSERVQNILEANKAALYQEFKSTEEDYGDVSTVTVGGELASYHPFTIDYDSVSGEYTLSYYNRFLNNLVDSLNDTDIHRYLADNIEVRTVVAGELTEEDLEGASLIYLASYVEDTEVINFNRYLNGEIGTNRLNMSLDNENIGAYTKDADGYTAITMADALTAGYDSYIKNDAGEYISSDMSWDMVESIIEYVYAGNEYTDGQPIPCIVNYGSNADTDTNAYKLANLLLKTSDEEDAEFDGVSTYYKNVMANINNGTYIYEGKSYSDWNDTSVPLFNITCAKTDDYVFNYVYKTDNSVDSLLFLMGSPNNFEETITDNGSAALRDITKAGEDYTATDAIRYLLSGGGEEKDSNRGSDRAGGTTDIVFRVLEIEPCQDFSYEYSEDAATSVKSTVFSNIKALGTALNIASYTKLSNYSAYEALANKRIEFKCVSTVEFNGMNEDLVASYDIIIIGTNTGMMNTMSNGTTIFNDNELDGYIYLAYGDLVKGQDFTLGYLPRDYFSVLKSDISNKGNYTFETMNVNNLETTTSWKDHRIVYSMYNKNIWSPLLLNSFSKSYYWLFNNNYTYTSFGSTRNKYYANDRGNTRLTGNDITDKKLNELLEFANIDRPVVIADNLYNCVSDSSAKVAYPTSNMYSFVNQSVSLANVIEKDDLAAELSTVVHDSVLEIESYKMVYEKNDVEYPAPAIAYGSDGMLLESCIVDGVEEFNYEVTFKAEVGKKYFVKAIIDKNTDGRFKSDATIDDFNEVYYAKMVIAESDTVTETLNIKLADGYNGMFAWKILIEEFNSSNVAVDAVSEQGYTVVRGDVKVVKALQITPNSTELDMSQAGTTFANLLKASTQRINYNVTFTRIKADDFEALYVSKPYTKGVSAGTEADRLKDYNMLVFGFADSWGGEDISDDYGALSNIVDYIEAGNSVLMSHDVLTFYNSANYNIWVNKSGNLVNKTGINGAFCLSLKLRDLIGMDVYSISTITDLSEATLEAENVPKKADGSFIEEIQGFTDWHIYRYNQRQVYTSTKSNSKIATLAPYKGAESYMPSNSSDDPGATSTMVSTKVAEVNRGQISMYPFNTTTEDGTLTIAQTHPQYYRVNLEDDELVVWYTIDDSGMTYNKYYSDSGKDAANNYYIYSKGSITYTGAGHSSMNVESELKLFVNTTIRAAMAGNFTPSIKITNGASTTDPNTFVVFPSVMENKIVVEFEAFDEDLATREIVQDTYPGDEAAIKEHIGRFQEGSITYVDKNGVEQVLVEYNRTTGPYLLNGEPMDFEIYNPYASYPSTQWDDLAAAETDPKTKAMYDCYIDYIEDGRVDIKISASDYAGAVGSSIVQIVKQELFPLD